MALAARNRPVLESLEAVVAPEHTALIVVDLQNDYCHPNGAFGQAGLDVSSCQQVVEPVARLVTAAHGAGVLTVFVQMAIDPNQHVLSGPERARRKRVVGPVDYVMKGSWGQRFVDGLQVGDDDIVVEKPRGSAFVGTSLDLVLRSSGIQTTVVTGVVTYGCVDATARDAMAHGYYVALPQDCVAAPNQELHQAALTLMAHHYGPEFLAEGRRVAAIWGAAVQRP